VHLASGGVTAMTTLFEQVANAIKQAKLVAVATIIAGPGIGKKLVLWPGGGQAGSLGDPLVERQTLARMHTLLDAQRSERFTVQTGGEAVEIFVDVQPPPPKLIIVGAVHIAIPLVTFGKALGFHTVVVDARSAFATPERFSHVDQLIIQWPADALAEIDLDESTCVVVLSHDEKIDIPALAMALRSPARYIGALGSKKTQARRAAGLREQGVTDDAIARIHSPIGLEIGARRPEEIAVAIIAEIVAVGNGVRD
jgi:xanthine dehydrogenase accessory factor